MNCIGCYKLSTSGISLFAGVVCGSLPSPNNGTVVLKGTTFGSVARYDCNSGFTLVGPQTRKCDKNGVWSGATPHCKGDLKLAFVVLF